MQNAGGAKVREKASVWVKGEGVLTPSDWGVSGWGRQGPKLGNVSAGAGWRPPPAPRLVPVSYGAQTFWAGSKTVFIAETIYSQCHCSVMFAVPGPTCNQENEASKEKERWAKDTPRRGTEATQPVRGDKEEQRKESGVRNWEQRGQKGKWQRQGWERSRQQLRKAVEQTKKSSPGWSR